MAPVILVIVIILGLGIAVWLWQISPGNSSLFVNPEENKFPEVSGFNLDRKEFKFPQNFEGELNLLIVAFQQHHQSSVNTWIPKVQALEADIPGFIYYELPTIKVMSKMSRAFINEGMRAGIPDQTARERTITLYINKDEFNSALNIPDEEDIYLFLVEKDGRIIWREKGSFEENKAIALEEILTRKGTK
jgi:hypothetical protein